MLHFKLLILILTILHVVCNYGTAKHITKEEWDSSHAKYQRDLEACREDKICKQKVKNDFLPILDEALETQFGSEMTCGRGDGQPKITKGETVDAELSCGARNPVEPKTNKHNIYRWFKH